MKRLLPFFVAWIAALSTGDPQPSWPVTVAGIEAGPQITGLQRDGQVWVRPEDLRLLGLAVRLKDGSVECQFGEKSVRLSLSPDHKRVALADLAGGLGAVLHHDAKSRKFTLLSPVRRVFADQDGIGFESELPVNAHTFTLKEPNRLVVDLRGANLGSGSSVEVEGPARASQFNPTTVRIVVETDKLPKTAIPTLSKGGSWLLVAASEASPDPDPPNATSEAGNRSGPVRLVSKTESVETFEFPVFLPPAGKVTFAKASTDSFVFQIPEAQWQAAEDDLGSLSQPEVSSGNGVTRLTFKMPRPMGVQWSSSGGIVKFTLYKPEVGDGKLAGKVVVVDPGHGGRDTGARSLGGKFNEKDLTLTIGKEVAAQLAKQGATVVMTRETDVAVELRERSEIANRNEADFFISVHINSNRVANSRSGNMTFHHKTDPIGMVLAECIQTEIAKDSGIPSLGVWSDGRIYSTGFAVLRYAKMPSVLLELGFINHATDLKRIREPDFAKKVATAVVRGLKVYLGNVKS